MTSFNQLWMALVFLFIASIPAYQVIRYSDLETQVLKRACNIDDLQNDANLKVDDLESDFTAQHHILGPLLAPFVNHQFNLPPRRSTEKLLDKVPVLIRLMKKEGRIAHLWSWGLLIVSFVYFGLAFNAGQGPRSDHVLFALTTISVVFLIVGVVAPALVILVMLPENSVIPQCVLHFDARSVLGVISQLYSSNYWFIAICLTIFSILIPLTKAVLVIVSLKSVSWPTKLKISKFLHFIGKWSMADVFVAATILAIFAVKADKSTQADLFLGFYYFFGYCLLSMVVTVLLENKFQGVEEKNKLNKELKVDLIPVDE